MRENLRNSGIDRKRVDEVLNRGEQCFRPKSENSLLPARAVEGLELVEILDIQAIQSLMDDFYKLTHIPIGLNDLKENVLAGVGWQDICTKFHRVHPEACKHCVESNIELSSGVSPGEFKMYRCKNNMWDIVTPIIVGGQHVGDIYAGQFFFEDEPVDYELFRAQARKYGFNEEEYIAALEKVPRLSREAVDTGMGFFMTFANMLSQLSYSNIQLVQALEERDALVNALQKTREDFDRAQAVGNIGGWRLDVRSNELTWSDENHRIFGIPKGAPLTYETFLSTIHPDDREYVDREWKAGLEGEPYDIEHRVIADDKIKWVREKAYLEFEKDGTLIGGFGITQDITERKKAEEALRLSNIYNRSLIEASLDPLVTIKPDGKIADVNNATETVTGCLRTELIGTDFSNYFTEPEEARKGYQQVFIQGEVRDYPLEIQHKDGHITPVLYNASVYRDENGEVIGVFAAARDITERKRAEHQLSNELARATGLYELYTRSSNLSDRELYDFALNQAVKITDSTIGFFHLVSEDEKEIILTTWNQEALRSCTAGNEGHYPIEKAGNWVDCVRLKRPVVYNDFPSSPNQKGLPVGHATVKRFMSVPVTENGKVRIIFGVGNKVDEYDDRDVMQLQLVANELHRIMKLRRIENEVRESEAFLRDIMENVSDAIFVKDREARMILANSAYYRLMGKSPEEVLNKTVADFHPPEIARKLAEDDKRVMETGKGTTLEGRIFTSHGWRILQTVKAPYYDGQGNIIGLIGAARDITERKKAEEALKKAYDNLEKLVKERTAELEKAYNSLKESEKSLSEAQRMAHIGNWDWDLVTGKFQLSDEVYRIFGRKPQESEVSYEKFLHYVHPDDRDYVDNIIKRSLTGGRRGIDHRIILHNGEERTVHTEREVIFDQNNTPVRARGTIQDITERKKAEKALGKIQETYIKEIHHRIKNNLQVISSLLSLEAEKFSDAKMLESFRESQNRVASMALIHEELYKGNELDTLDFAAYLQKLTADLFDSYNLKNSGVSLKLDLEKIPLVMDIAIPLGIIVNELVSNSLKHAFPAGKTGEIHISLCKKESFAANYDIPDLCPSCMEKNDLYYILTVEDNGKGIPEEIEFPNTDSLGFQLVNLLVEQIDGYIELKRNNGTKFSIRFRNIEP